MGGISRYGTRGGIEPSQTVASAEVFVDLAPWEAGALPQAMVTWNNLAMSRLRRW